ncbi:MAG: hypothetical protein ACYS8W_18095 [Planctomycetota bacterium]|jgi:hypothetical protein
MPDRILYLIQSEYHHFGLAPVIIHTHRLMNQLDARLTLIQALGAGKKKICYFHDSFVERDLPRLQNLLRYAIDVGEVSEEELPRLAEQLRIADNAREAYRRLAVQRYVAGSYPDYDTIRTVGALAGLKAEGVEISIKPTEKFHAVYGQAELRKLLAPGVMERIRAIATRVDRAKALFREIIDIRSTFILDNISEFAEDINIAFLGIDHILSDLEDMPNLKVYRILIELGANDTGIVLNGDLPEDFLGKIPAQTENRIPIDDAISYLPE